MAIGATIRRRFMLESQIGKLRFHISMACQTHRPASHSHHPWRLASVRIMACQTGSYCDRPMDKAAFEFILLMTFKTNCFERRCEAGLPASLGASPVSVAQTRRLLFAKKLLDETSLPMTQIAFAAGFALRDPARGGHGNLNPSSVRSG